jgi:protein-histidine pros-kinase
VIATREFPRLKTIAWSTLSVATVTLLITSIVMLWGDREGLLWIALAATSTAVAVLASELRRIHKEKATAQRSNMAKGRFLANISEEIRTPMDGIVGMTDLLLLSGLTSDQEQFAETVKSSARSLLKTLNEMLDYARIIDGQVQFTDFDFDLHDLIDTSVSRYAAAASEKGLDLICHIAPNVPEVVRGDPVRFQQVLDQLVGNALKFTTCGEVRVYARWLGDTDEAHVIQVEVHDTGPGIEGKQAARVFDSYAAVRGDTKQTGTGGIGLAIAKQIITSARGSLDFQTEPGAGTTFWIVLPLRRANIQLPHLNSAIVLAGVRVQIDCRVQSLRNVLADYCRSLGMTVVDSKPDVLITDAPDQRLDLADKPTLLIGNSRAPSAHNGHVIQQPVRRRELETALLASVHQPGPILAESQERLLKETSSRSL